MRLNDWPSTTVNGARDDAAGSTLVHGFVGNASFDTGAARAIELGDVIGGDDDVAYLKIDVEGAEADALTAPSARGALLRVRYAYVEVTLYAWMDHHVDDDAGDPGSLTSGPCARAATAMRALVDAGMQLYRLRAASGGAHSWDPLDARADVAALCAESLGQVGRGVSAGVGAACEAGIAARDRARLRDCCDQDPSACQWDVFAARPPASFDLVIPADATTSARAAAAAARPRHVLVEVVDKVTWGAPAVGDDGLVRLGVAVHHREWSRGVGHFHLSVRATPAAPEHFASEVCGGGAESDMLASIEPSACQQLVGLIEDAVRPRAAAEL